MKLNGFKWYIHVFYANWKTDIDSSSTQDCHRLVIICAPSLPSHDNNCINTAYTQELWLDIRIARRESKHYQGMHSY